MPDASSPTVADAPKDNWADRYLPRALTPYARLARLDRPIGWWLLLLPCWWGLALASIATGAWPDWRLALLFLAGAIVLRGAGCTLNDLADRDIDAKVARTRARPIPSGAVSVRQALMFLAAQCAIGLIILLQFNWFTVWLGAASLLIVAVYPYMKRITDWPQAVLGLAFNWGALIGWSAVTGSLGSPAVLLYAGGIAWTLGYDTIYALQDKDDDALIGVRSSALRLGNRAAPAVALFFTVALILTGAAIFAAGGRYAYLGLAAAAVHALWQVTSLNPADPQNCLTIFRANRSFGLLILAGLLLDGLL